MRSASPSPRAIPALSARFRGILPDYLTAPPLLYPHLPAGIPAASDDPAPAHRELLSPHRRHCPHALLQEIVGRRRAGRPPAGICRGRRRDDAGACGPARVALPGVPPLRDENAPHRTRRDLAGSPSHRRDLTMSRLSLPAFHWQVSIGNSQLAIAVALLALLLPPRSPAQTAVEIPDTGWRLWLDREAPWQTDSLYLPGDARLARPARAPSDGGWKASMLLPPSPSRSRPPSRNISGE